MPIVENDITYYRHRGETVVNADGSGPIASLTGGRILVNGTQVDTLELQSRAPQSTVQTNAVGQIADLWVPLGDPENDVVAIDWDGDGIDPQIVDLAYVEVVALLRSVAESVATEVVGDAVTAAIAAITPQSLGLPWVVDGVDDPETADLTTGDQLDVYQ